MRRKPLNFDQLRAANVERCQTAFHPVDEWNLAEWGCALAGEAGEAANLAKKIRRIWPSGTIAEAEKDQDGTIYTPEETIKSLGEELADVVIYADLMAARAGLDLGECVRLKFNRVSFKIGSPVALDLEFEGGGW